MTATNVAAACTGFILGTITTLLLITLSPLDNHGRYVLTLTIASVVAIAILLIIATRA